MTEHHHKHKSFFSSLGFVMLSVLAFVIIYTIIFFAMKSTLSKSYDAANQAIPMVKTGLSNPAEVTKYFDKFAWLGSVAFGLIALVMLLVFYGISALVKLTKYSFTAGFVMILAYSILLAFAFVLVFLEKAYVPWANGIIFFMGPPLFYATIIMILASAGAIFLARGKAQ